MGKPLTPANGTPGQATGPARAVDYLRVSTRTQAKGHGLAYTGRNASIYIADKGWEHVGTYSDEGVSGTLRAHGRDALKHLMADARRIPRPFDVVVVNETRAIGRTGPSFWTWLWELEDLGIFVAVADDYDTSTGAGRSRMHQGARYAIQEHKNIRSRTQGGIQEKAEGGGHPGGAPRYGYRILNPGRRGEQRVVIDECDGGDRCSRSIPCTTRHEAPVLRRARQLAVEEQGKWGRVALALNREGCRTRSGRRWSEANIRSRLMDEDLLTARYVFRKPSRAFTRSDGAPLWGESLVIPLDPVFTEAEVAELRSAVSRRPKVPPVQRNCYTLSGRIWSLCGKHYVGGSPAGEKSPHYVCSGKRPPYAGASVCSCPQIYATGVEDWAWDEVCALLGDGERLRAPSEERFRLRTRQAANRAARVTELDQLVMEQDETIRLVAGITAKSAMKRGLAPTDAEVAVDRALRPLLEEREQLKQALGEAASWHAEAIDEEQHASEFRTLARSSPEGLKDLSQEFRREVMNRLDIRIEITGPPPPMRRGLVCPVADWFRREARLVPALTDEAWSRLIALDLFPDGEGTARQKGGLAPRTVLEALLKKARTDARWAQLDAEHGSTGLRGHWRRWMDSGLWEALMNALEGCPGTPPTKPHPLPSMEVTAQVTPDALIAVADLACHALRASGPWGSACCSSGRPWPGACR
ncbi:recombinase family protein [Streptomyces sp. NPDC060031]|uniref:recombinase family protein n=1 Tax=Streptomyces sp. NPDC060031 TaxID=3347043 RepID=UPI0036BE753B